MKNAVTQHCLPSRANLYKEGPLYALVLSLGRQPALTQEHVHLFCFQIQYFHLVQVPIGPHHGVVMTDANLKHLAQVHSLNSELIHLRNKEKKNHSVSHRHLQFSC